MSITPLLDTDLLEQLEKDLANVLYEGGKLNRATFDDFIGMRKRSDKDGKPYLGDILVTRGYVDREHVESFFEQNNALYLNFCEELAESGFMSKDQLEKVLADDASKRSVVSVMERLGIMTKASFTKHLSNRVNTLRLGDWLLAKGILDKVKLNNALEEQNIYRLEDYVVYHGIASREEIDKIKSALAPVDKTTDANKENSRKWV